MRAYYDAVARSELATQTSRLDTKQMIHRHTLHYRALAVLLLLATVALSGCVYRANISQGNLIKQDDLDQVEVGMTKSQVRFLLGTPMIDDPFHSDRWDYVYYLKIGRRDADFKRWVSIVFQDNTVVEIRKDLELDPNI